MGRPWPTRGEPLWLNEDRAWALALAQVETENCPDCGRPWSEVSDPDNEFKYQTELIRCHACTTATKAVSAYQNRGGDSRGLHVTVTKRGG
jgi:hypothetical protein